MAMWPSTAGKKGVDFCKRLYDAGVESIIYTDIACDGAMQGTNLAVYRQLRGITGLKITASGGICSIEELQSLNGMGIDAAILGKSLYTGAIDLAAAVQAVQQEAKGERK